MRWMAERSRHRRDACRARGSLRLHCALVRRVWCVTVARIPGASASILDSKALQEAAVDGRGDRMHVVAVAFRVRDVVGGLKRSVWLNGHRCRDGCAGDAFGGAEWAPFRLGKDTFSGHGRGDPMRSEAKASDWETPAMLVFLRSASTGTGFASCCRVSASAG